MIKIQELPCKPLDPQLGSAPGSAGYLQGLSSPFPRKHSLQCLLLSLECYRPAGPVTCRSCRPSSKVTGPAFAKLRLWDKSPYWQTCYISKAQNGKTLHFA